MNATPTLIQLTRPTPPLSDASVASTIINGPTSNPIDDNISENNDEEVKRSSSNPRRKNDYIPSGLAL